MNYRRPDPNCISSYESGCHLINIYEWLHGESPPGRGWGYFSEGSIICPALLPWSVSGRYRSGVRAFGILYLHEGTLFCIGNRAIFDKSQ